MCRTLRIKKFAINRHAPQGTLHRDPLGSLDFVDEAPIREPICRAFEEASCGSREIKNRTGSSFNLKPYFRTKREGIINQHLDSILDRRFAMAIITISRGTFSGGNALAERLADRLGVLLKSGREDAILEGN